MVRAKTGESLVIHLDSRVALEGNLLNRHRCLPASRRQEWLRGLLLQGFRDEYQLLRGTPDHGPRRSWMTFTRSVRSATPRPATACDQSSMHGNAPVPVNHTATKPFTALSKVIG